MADQDIAAYLEARRKHWPTTARCAVVSSTDLGESEVLNVPDKEVICCDDIEMPANEMPQDPHRRPSRTARRRMLRREREPKLMIGGANEALHAFLLSGRVLHALRGPFFSPVEMAAAEEAEEEEPRARRNIAGEEDPARPHERVDARRLLAEEKELRAGVLGVLPSLQPAPDMHAYMSRRRLTMPQPGVPQARSAITGGIALCAKRHSGASCQTRQPHACTFRARNTEAAFRMSRLPCRTRRWRPPSRRRTQQRPPPWPPPARWTSRRSKRRS